MLATLLAGCGGVDIAESSVSASERAACTELVEALPDEVSDQPRRKTSGSPLGAAWGDPAIVLTCGVGKPEDYDRFANCQTVNGVDWFVPEETVGDQSADVVLTTIGRTPSVELKVPASYRPPAAAMVDVSRAIRIGTRTVAPCS